MVHSNAVSEWYDGDDDDDDVDNNAIQILLLICWVNSHKANYRHSTLQIQVITLWIITIIIIIIKIIITIALKGWLRNLNSK
jgi:hypothetical protein